MQPLILTAMATANPLGIGNAHLSCLIDGRLRAHYDLFDISIVNRLRFTDDRHRCIVENCVAVQQEKQM